MSDTISYTFSDKFCFSIFVVVVLLFLVPDANTGFEWSRTRSLSFCLNCLHFDEFGVSVVSLLMSLYAICFACTNIGFGVWLLCRQHYL